MLTEISLNLVDEEMIVDFVERKGVQCQDKFGMRLSRLELFFRHKVITPKTDEMGNVAYYLFCSKVSVLESSIPCGSMNNGFWHVPVHTRLRKHDLIKGALNIVALRVRECCDREAISNCRFES